MTSDHWLSRGAVLAYGFAIGLAARALLELGGVAALSAGLLTVALVVTALQAVVITGPRRLLVIVAAGLLAIAVTTSFVVGGVWEAAVLVPGLVGVGAFLHLRWRRSRIHTTLPRPPEGFRAERRSVLFVNPRSGDGTAERIGLAAKAREVGVEVVELDGETPVHELARQAADDGVEVLGVAGGDGSIAAVAEVAIEHELPLVVVPAGTRNHLAQDLGLDRTDPLAALAAFTHPEERRIDVACVNERTFLNNVSLGVYAALVDQEGYREAKIGTLLEALPAMWAEGGPWFDLRFEVPDHGPVEQAALLQVSNGAYALTGDLFRRPRLDEGCLGFVTVDPDRLRDLVALSTLTAVGRPEAASALWSWKGAELEVESDQDVVVVGIDGERVELAAPLRFTCKPSALLLHVPEGTRVGLEEQTPEQRGHVDLLTAALGIEGSDD
jgi:diacylglycerol kinase family enzyme